MPTEPPRRVELFFGEAVRTEDGRDCAAVIDLRVCFRGSAVESMRRDVGRDWRIEAYHSTGTLFRDLFSGKRFRSVGFAGKVHPVDLDGPANAGRLTIENGDLWVWNGTDFERAILPGRVVIAATDGEEVEAVVEPGVVWRGEPTHWDMLRWRETRFLLGGTATLRGVEVTRSVEAAERVEALVNEMLRTGELELGRRSEHRPYEWRDEPWSWSSAPPRPELVLDGVLPPFGLPRNADLDWEVGVGGFGLVRRGHRDFGRPIRVEWMGLGGDGRSFVAASERTAGRVHRVASVMAAQPGWVLRAELSEGRSAYEHRECELVLIRADAEEYRRRFWYGCAFDTLGALSLPLGGGRTGVLVHDGSHRHLFEIDERGRLLGERSIMGPELHRDEWIEEVDGRLAHVVASRFRAKAHFIDGEDQTVGKLRAPSGVCSEDSGRLVAASHLGPRMKFDGRTDERFDEPRLWRSYWIARSSTGTCVRAGFERYPLAWWADGSGVRGWRWDARHGPASMHEGVEPERPWGRASIETRGADLFVLVVDDASVRLLRVSDEGVDEVEVPPELSDADEPPELGPGGVLYTRTHGWAPGRDLVVAPEGFALRDGILAGRGEMFFLRESSGGELQVVNGEGVPLAGPVLAPEGRHAFGASTRGAPRIVSGGGEWTLVPGRSGTPALGTLMRSDYLPPAASCARVDLVGSEALTPPIGCRDSAFAVSADERLVAYHARVVGAENPSHVRIARRVGTRWVEWGDPIEMTHPSSGIWVDGSLHVVMRDGDGWLLKSFRRGRWSAQRLEPTADAE
ncbi:MAG: hypothetical protein JJ863_24650 [Deltaproteobacteria bacterium]|nr:hypothetical protein [Deltaproteobacteria bacterium]